MASAKSGSKRKGLSGQALKDFRHSVSVLRSKGLVSKRVDARSQKDTRYMRAKVKALQDVIEGNAIVARVKPEVARQYRATGQYKTTRDRVVVPKSHPLTKVRVEKRGFVETVTPLKNGEQSEVYLPIPPQGLRGFIKKMIAERDTIDALKEGDEYFSFRIGENNSKESFADTDEMAEYLMKYADRPERPITTRKEVQQLFTFQRFRTKNGTYPEDGRNPHESGKPKIAFPDIDQKGRNTGKREETKRKQAAAKKRRQRKAETPEQREKRLAGNRRRTAQWKQWQFENR